MKRIKLFEEFVNEMEIGKVLLGDPSAIDRPETLKALKIPHEVNTLDEEELISLLKDWILRPHAASKNPKLGQLLKELLPLKSKFPKILDPKMGRSAYEGKSFYRGTMIPLKDVMALKGSWYFNGDVNFSGGAMSINTVYNWQGLGESQKGFTSFTPSASVAQEFAIEAATNMLSQSTSDQSEFVRALVDNRMSRMIPVILEIPDTYPNAIMNPKFTAALTVFLSEYEVFVLGRPIKCSKIHIPEWESYERAFDAMGVDSKQYFK
jgi:hypothetical protein